MLSALITIGVVYNAARIQLAERAHDPASLRVLGFSRGAVGYVLVGEMMLQTMAAIPYGWLSGYGFTALISHGISSDLFTIPLVIARRTYAAASLLVFFAALGASLVVRRRLDFVDMVSTLKQKE
ncbi:MAG: hypothetical protein H7245_17925 [Candidatus Saccharibacteria bacterium]|nr:hypothetical protein [Pseudorhodobacter sp.]